MEPVAAGALTSDITAGSPSDATASEVPTELLEDWLVAEETATRSLLSLTASILCGPLTIVLVSGIACLTQDAAGFENAIGKCPRGLLPQIVMDAAPAWGLTILEFCVLVIRYKIPCSYMYSHLDPLIIIIMLVAGYLNVSLIFLTSMIHLPGSGAGDTK